MKKDWALVWTSLAFLVLCAIYIFFPFESAVFQFVYNFGGVITPFVVFIVALFVLSRMGYRSMYSKTVLLLALGELFWGVAELVWVLNDHAVTSIADPIYLAGYIFIFFALIVGIKMSCPDLWENKIRLIISLFLGLFVVFLYFAAVPASWNQELSFVENSVTAGYSLADLILLLPSIVLAYLVLAGSLSAPWVLVLLSSIFSMAGDFWYMQNYEVYEQGGKFFMELTWRLGDFLYLYAMVLFLRAHEANLAFLRQPFRPAPAKATTAKPAAAPRSAKKSAEKPARRRPK